MQHIDDSEDKQHVAVTTAKDDVTEHKQHGIRVTCEVREEE